MDGITAEQGDLRPWAEPDPPALRRPVDVLVTNAALQWVPGHLELVPRLLERVASEAGSRCRCRATSRSRATRSGASSLRREPYAEHLTDVATPAAHDAETYLRVLQWCGAEVDA